MPASPEFEALVRAHYAALYRFALGLSKRESDAADLVQETFLIWARKGDALRDRSKAKTWLFTTLYREFLRGRRHAGWIEPTDGEVLQNAADEDPRALEALNASDARDALAAVQAVDEVFRVPLLMFYVEQLPYRDIAERLGVPIGTVMSRLSRGKAQLRAKLLPSGNKPTPGGSHE